MSRADGRTPDQLRPVSFRVDVQPSPAASVEVTFGGTTVLISVTIEEGAPRWRDHGGWLTAEYAMLPGATNTRAGRDRKGPSGRSKEIERLLGRSLRAAVDLDALHDVTLLVDADVLIADGGTRTAAITGGWVGVARALRTIGAEGALRHQLAAVSVGLIDGVALLDLPYEEDSRADVDMNVVASPAGQLVEVQGTAEGTLFSRAENDQMMDLALAGITQLGDLQLMAVEA